MSFIDDDGTDGSFFVWAIQNFSYCLQNPKEYLESPSFVLDTNETDRWQLRLYPRGVYNANFSEFKHIGFRLHIKTNSSLSRRVEFALSIRTTGGSYKKHQDSMYVFSRGDSTLGYPEFLTSEKLRKKGAESYLDNDTITLRCRIWNVDGKRVPPEHCYMRTIIKVERTTAIWALEKFQQNMSSNEIAENQPISSEKSSFVAMKFILPRGKDFSGDIIKLEVKQKDENNPCFLTCEISLLDDGGEIVHVIRDEHKFEASRDLQVWMLPYVPMTKILAMILDCEKPYLRCELAVSSESECSWIERFENGKVEDHQSTRFKLKKEQNFNDSWKDDLKRFYSYGVFTDVSIRTPTKEFLVHKAILCARSTVFHAMFERDMKENKPCVVEIEDIDTDTVHKMLLFAYSDVVEDLDCDMASKLYFAADKYRITALRRRCTDFLKENLSVSNVCEVLVLANMHQDEDLKSFAKHFIMEHAAEVIISMDWKKFMQSHVHLASETMHDLLLQNLNIAK